MPCAYGLPEQSGLPELEVETLISRDREADRSPILQPVSLHEEDYCPYRFAARVLREAFENLAERSRFIEGAHCTGKPELQKASHLCQLPLQIRGRLPERLELTPRGLDFVSRLFDLGPGGVGFTVSRFEPMPAFLQHLLEITDFDSRLRALVFEFARRGLANVGYLTLCHEARLGRSSLSSFGSNSSTGVPGSADEVFLAGAEFRFEPSS
jgi:hypothetical protein